MVKNEILKALMQLVYNGGIRDNNKGVYGPEVLDVLTYLGKVDPVFREEEGVLFITLKNGCKELAISYDMNTSCWCAFFTKYDSSAPENGKVVKEVSAAYEDRLIEDHEHWFQPLNLHWLETTIFPTIGMFCPATLQIGDPK